MPSQEPEFYASSDPIQNIAPGVQVIAVHGTDGSLVDAGNSEHDVDAAG